MARLLPILFGLGAMCVSFAPAPAAAGGTVVATVNGSVQVNATNASVAAQAGVATGTGNPTCSGAACEGLDPFASGCANDATAVTAPDAVHYGNQIVAQVALEFSPSCNASWAQITVLQPVGLWAPWPVANAFVNATDLVPDHTYTGATINAGNSWTPMIGGGFHAQACIDRAGTPAYDCTSIS